VITVLESVVVLLENLAYEAGVGKKLASIRWVNIPVLELGDRSKLMNALVEESEKALCKDQAHALILGCTGMMGVADELSAELFKRGHRVPLIYPVSTALAYLEALVNLKLAQSKKTYQFPSNKERNLWERLGS
jgi:allantoin racemase